MASARAMMVRALERDLLPVFMAMGFEQIPLLPDERSSRELKSAFPLGRLRRRKGTDVELIEIQFYQHCLAKYRLNFGTVPAIGVTHSTGHFAQEDACVSWLYESAELLDGRFFRRWFGVSNRIPEPEMEPAINASVARTIALAPQVDAWLTHKKRGSHVRVVKAGKR